MYDIFSRATCGYGSESEAEDPADSHVTLPQQVPGRGNIKSEKSAIRLTEVLRNICFNDNGFRVNKTYQNVRKNDKGIDGTERNVFEIFFHGIYAFPFPWGNTFLEKCSLSGFWVNYLYEITPI